LPRALAPPKVNLMAQPDPIGSPEPTETAEKEESTHSGRLLLRMPPSLHAELARAAEREGVSLNAFISSALSGAVHWRAGAMATQAAAPGRLLRVAVIVDIVLVAVAAVVAVVLLLSA
jgi:hypothetical protein